MLSGNEWNADELTEWGMELDYIAPGEGDQWDEMNENEQEPTDLDAQDKDKPYVLKITFPDAEKMSAFVQTYKDVLENDYQCSMSESGGGL